MLMINQHKEVVQQASFVNRIGNSASIEPRNKAAGMIEEALEKLVSKADAVRPTDEASGVVFEQRSKFAASLAAIGQQSFAGVAGTDAGLNGKTTTSFTQTSISDMDMARETAERTKLTILTQANTAMLAQANSMPHMIMQLLGR